MPDLFTIGKKIFYSYENKYLSIPTKYRLTVENAISEYIISLKYKSGSPLIPTIKEPDNMLDDDVFLLKYDDFILTNELSAAQYNQRKTNGINSLYNTLSKALKGYSREKEYKRKELVPPLNDKNLKHGVNNGFLLNEKWGYYKINFQDIDDNELYNEEQDEQEEYYNDNDYKLEF